MKKYYLHNGQEKEGPYSLEELSEKQMNLDTPIWYKGLPYWTSASKIPEINQSIFDESPPPFNKNFFGSEATNEKAHEYKNSEIIHNPKPKKNRKRNAILLGALILVIISISAIWYNQESNKSTFRRFPEFYIKHKNVTWSYHELGGITDLRLTIANESDYQVEDAKILISYIRRNGEVYKEEIVSSGLLLPKSSVNVSAPKSDAGIKVQVKFYSARSHEAGLR